MIGNFTVPENIDGPVAPVRDDPLVKRIVRVQVRLVILEHSLLLVAPVRVISLVSPPNLVIIITDTRPGQNSIWLATSQRHCGAKEHDDHQQAPRLHLLASAVTVLSSSWSSNLPKLPHPLSSPPSQDWSIVGQRRVSLSLSLSSLSQFVKRDSKWILVRILVGDQLRTRSNRRCGFGPSSESEEAMQATRWNRTRTSSCPSAENRDRQITR